MSLETAMHCKLFLTDIALVWIIAKVYPYVTDETAGFSECFCTNVTYERAFNSVHTLVFSESTLIGVRLVGQITRVWP